MPELHETRMGQRLIEGTLPRIAEALEAIASGGSAGGGRFSPREIVLLYEAVEYFVADVATKEPEDREYELLKARLLVLSGRAPAPPTR